MRKPTASLPREAIALVALILATTAVYLPVASHDFVELDDPSYVTENPHVTSGITGHNIDWAFTEFHSCNWHPLTWLSHMLDCEVFGLKPGPHHVTSLALHVASVALLFLLLRSMTGAFWPCVVTAGLFGLHPLHVESVAWISERKDVLSGFFFLLTLWAYARFARSADRGIRKSEFGAPKDNPKEEKPPTVHVEGSTDAHSAFRIPHSRRWYILILLFFTLGLLAKPMLVTVPFVLLLLDFWPLGRMADARDPRALIRLVIEKTPFFALAAASCMITVAAQRGGGAVSKLAVVPFTDRLANAAVSYWVYLGRLFWPARLAVYYPLLHPPAVAVAAAAVAGLVCVTTAVVLVRQRCPFLLTGWLWYLGMLVPVIGLVQVGAQATADRYTYLPAIGIYVALVWQATAIAGASRMAKKLCATTAAIVLALLFARTAIQVRYWRNSLTLFPRTLQLTQRNYLIHFNYGVALDNAGRFDEAIAQYQRSVEIHPAYLNSRINLGVLLEQKGDIGAAREHFAEAVKLAPKDGKAHLNAAFAAYRLQEFPDALTHFREAIRLSDEIRTVPDVHVCMGIASASMDDLDGAIVCFREALRIAPGNPAAKENLSRALRIREKTDP